MKQLATALVMSMLFVYPVAAQDSEQPQEEDEVVVEAPMTTSETIYYYAAKHGVSGSQMYNIMYCETVGFTKFEGDYYRGRPTSHGWGQLHEGGLLEPFYAMGYTDTYDLAQVSDFMGYEIRKGNRYAWHC